MAVETWGESLGRPFLVSREVSYALLKDFSKGSYPVFKGC